MMIDVDRRHDAVDDAWPKYQPPPIVSLKYDIYLSRGRGRARSTPGIIHPRLSLWFFSSYHPFWTPQIRFRSVPAQSSRSSTWPKVDERELGKIRDGRSPRRTSPPRALPSLFSSLPTLTYFPPQDSPFHLFSQGLVVSLPPIIVTVLLSVSPLFPLLFSFFLPLFFLFSVSLPPHPPPPSFPLPLAFFSLFSPFSFPLFLFFYA